tara:strand:+ start:1498 stop:1743 length:246 start_codon:yes stop_codon:yes gene_type:complete
MGMKMGDLLHIPQAVTLWTADKTTKGVSMPYIQTERPMIALYLGSGTGIFGMEDALITVLLKGRTHFVHSKDVYLFKENKC